MSYRRRRHIPRRVNLGYGYSATAFSGEVPTPTIGAEIRTDLTSQRLRVFDNPTEYLQVCGGRPEATSHRHAADSWTGYATHADAVRLGRDGWPEGRGKVEQLTGGLVAYLATRIHREEWIPDLEGHFFDLGLVLEGEPEHWIRPDTVDSEVGTAKRHVRIVLNGIVSSGIGPEVIEKRGAALAALSDLLELAGHMVTVGVVFTTGNHRDNEGITDIITIKSTNERVDLDKLMFWLAHPAASRRLAFAAYESYPEEVREKYGIYQYGGYGRCTEPIFPSDHKPDIYMGTAGLATSHMWLDLKAVQSWLEKTLTALGVHLAPKGD